VGQGKAVPVDLGNSSQYFDHTSILRTIAARFMSSNPPFMGKRYAAANDLSSVLGDTLRTTQFLPFVSHSIIHDASQKSVSMNGANLAATAMPFLHNANKIEAQEFSFEDAEDGYVFIRSHSGSRYLTVDVPPSVNRPTASLAIKQDIKYRTKAARPNNVDHQRWKFTPTTDVSAPDNELFVITNASFAHKVLQLKTTTRSGVAVVLGDTPAGAKPQGWRVHR
jgi:hypothetical protein